ncbi:MAG: DUF2341 domain-containing protein [Nanoarchaeales archaeon]
MKLNANIYIYKNSSLKKLISAYIATIIILVITIGIGAILYFYFSGYISELTSETEETTIKSIVECSKARIDSYAYKEFKYRIPITIKENSGNNLTDYQILVTLDTASLISQGKMRSDCGDIRFTDSDGITLLNYWIEPNTCNTENTRIWVKVPYIPASSTKTIYLYYGNPEATSLSNVKDVFIREIDGLVLYLPFDEGSGTIAYDYSGNNNHGTIYNGTQVCAGNSTYNTTCPQWVDGKFGKALSFDGVDDYVELEGFCYQQMTLFFWVNPDYQINGTFQYSKDIIRKGDEWGVTTHFDFNTNRLIRINYRYFGASSWWLVSDIPLDINKWNFISVIWDMPSGAIMVLINNIKRTYTVGSGTMLTCTMPIKIATGYAGSFKGLIDEVKIYNRALSEEEISDLYNNYGYSTPNYPGKTLVRKYVSPEPTISLQTEEISPIIKLTILNLGIDLGKKLQLKLIYEDNKTETRNINLNETFKSGDFLEIPLKDLPKGKIKKIEIYCLDVCPGLLVGIKSVNIEV